MAAERNDVDEIRLQMAKIRSALHQEMREVVGGAAAATDWRSYARKRPWLGIGIAFVSGYLLVPRRTRPTPAGMPSIQPVMTATSPPASVIPQKTFRPIWWTLSAVAPIALRAVQSYALSAIEKALIPQQSDTSTAQKSTSQQPTGFGGRDYSSRR